MATWQVQNFSARKLETALHHIFEDKQLQIEVPTITGGVEIPKEWYLVTLEEIEETVNKLVSDLLI
ncbi:GIY-YIG nuclease family protein [Lactococcus lactis]|nr:GIY-YIG nuclease family protein [Lactococcus lactis]